MTAFITLGCCSSLFVNEVFPVVLGSITLAGVFLPFAVKSVGDTNELS